MVSLLHALRAKAASLPYRALTLRPCREHETILLTGSPRSGTTWVGSLLSAEPERAMITEPLHLGLRGARDAGFDWRTHRHPGDAWSEGERLLRRLFQGRGFGRAVLGDNDWATLIRYRKLLVKSVRATRLLPWIATHFRLGGIVYLVRHPCAVVASQMANPAFPSYGVPDFDIRYVERYLPHLAGRIRALEHEEEVRTLTWILDQHAALASPLRHRWVLLPYERLVGEGEREMARLFHHLGLPMTCQAKALLRRSSREAREWSADHERGDLEERLGGWHRRLRPEQTRRILDLVEQSGLTGWSEDVVPDFTAIAATR